MTCREDCIWKEHGHGGACMNEDEQEAQSTRYVDALRVIPLSSGRWAAYGLGGYNQPTIMDTLDPERLKSLREEQRARDAELKARIKPRAPAPKPQAGKISIDLDTLFGGPK
jgi:hypothetical protein